MALLAALLLLLLAAPASAALRHSVFTNEIGPDGTAATNFGGGFRNVGFSQGNKRIIVGMESETHSIAVNSPGSYTPVPGFPFSTQINNDGDVAVSSGPGGTAGFIYTVQDGPVYRAWTASGSEAGEFNAGGEICGLAVDNAGDIWAGNWNRNQIEEYPPGGASTPTQTINTNSIGRVCKLTVDPVTKDVYAMTYSFGPIYKFSAASGYTEFKEIFGNGDFRMDVNGAKHVLYVTNNTETIYAIDTNTGAILEEIKPGGAFRGVAVDESNDTLYAFSYDTGRVKEIPLSLVPKAVTGEPVANSKVSGTVAPDGAGNITACEFEWGEEANNYTKPPVPCEQATPITTETAVTATLPGAVNETTYHYRVVARTATPGGVNFGLDETITPHKVPALKTEAATEVARTTAKLHGSFTGNGEATEYKFEWGLAGGGFTSNSGFLSAGTPGVGVHKPLEFPASGLTAGKTYEFRVVAKNGLGESVGNTREFTTLPAVANLHTTAPTNVLPTSAELNGDFDIDAEGGDTHWYFEFGETESYGSIIPALPGEDAGSAPGHPSVTETVSTNPGTVYHYRLVAENSLGTTAGNDVEFKTPQPPKVISVTAVNVTATTAELVAVLNPEGAPATYQFEYGTTTAYGQVSPGVPESIGSGTNNVQVTAQLSGLTVGATYHFRVTSVNPFGQQASQDQTFEFFTPNCPNAHLRQQTGAAYLPDCRAYELVSPRNAGGVQIFPGVGVGPIIGEEFPIAPSPNNGLATQPSRFSFWAGIGQMPGTNPPNILQDPYVATRTDTGWETHFPGVPGNQALASGKMSCNDSMSQCISYHFKDPLGTNPFDKGSKAPYLFNSNENSVIKGRFPTDVESIENAEEFEGEGKPSGDFSHFAFSSNNIAFTTDGLEAPPGSAYDNNTGAGTIDLISVDHEGDPLEQDPGGCTTETNKDRQCQFEVIRIPAISRDGSHILMSTWAPPPGGEFKEKSFSTPDFLKLDNLHLTMRVDDAVSYDVTKGHRGNFVGMTPDGSKVFFTSDEHVTADDHDESVDLFMWEEATDSVTRISTGSGGTGDTDSCSTGWTEKCSVQMPSASIETDEEDGTILTPDNWVADNGNVYFYSPELLDGSGNGAVGKRNLYVYRNGHVQFVAKLAPAGPATRMNINPTDSRVAIVSTSQLTGYENEGHAEMYTIDPGITDPSTGQPLIVCVSCNPTGAAPTGSVQAAMNGRFMSDDGRTFFSTAEALVPFDTDGIRDVYEYVQGRPQLISSGTGQQDTWGGGLLIYPPMTVGLEGVSADGVDVYFSTFETLTSQDENGEFIKIYDARSGGGFPAEEPLPPCKAADECHGAGSVTPPAPQVGTVAKLGTTGNHPPKCKKGKVRKNGKCVPKKKGKKHKSHKRHRHRGAAR